MRRWNRRAEIGNIPIDWGAVTMKTCAIAVALATLLGVGSVTPATAQVHVDGIDVVRTGIYKLGKYKEIKNPAISTGQRYEAPATLLRRTTIIPAKTGTTFGLDIMIRGRPRGRLVPFRIVWRYPEPGLRNPDTGKVKLVDDYIDEKNLGHETSFMWSLGADWTAVPGRWTFEIWYEGRMLATQSFTLVKQ
jgi:Domain of unknown function (DUF3859)